MNEQASGGLSKIELPFVIFVPGRARTKGSLQPLGNGRMADSRLSSAWRSAVAEAVCRRLGAVPGPRGSERPYEALSGPVRASLSVDFPRPRAGTTDSRPIARGWGDLDKLIRNIGDALEDAGVVSDDAQFSAWLAEKRWAPIGQPAGVWLMLQMDT